MGGFVGFINSVERVALLERQSSQKGTFIILEPAKPGRVLG